MGNTLEQNPLYVIEETGGLIHSNKGLRNFFVYRHLVVDAELDEKRYEELATEHDIDFISVAEERVIEFIHVTSPDNEDSISRLGLLRNNKGRIGDLGEGVYVIDVNDEKGKNNLLEYIECKWKDGFEEEDEDVLIVEGTYFGSSLRCVYGDSHKGFIVLKGEVKHEMIESLETKSYMEISIYGID